MRKQRKGDEVVACQVVSRKSLKVETEGAIAIDDEDRALVAEQSSIAGHRQATGRTHQFLLEGELDIDAVDLNRA